MGNNSLTTLIACFVVLSLTGCAQKTFVFFQTSDWNGQFFRIVGEEFELLLPAGRYSIMGMGIVEDQDSLLVLHYRDDPRMQYQDSAILLEAREKDIELCVVNTSKEFIAFHVRYGNDIILENSQYVTARSGDTVIIQIPTDSATVNLARVYGIPFKRDFNRPGLYELHMDLESYGAAIIEQKGNFKLPVSRRTSDSIFIENHKGEEYGYFLRVKGSDNQRRLNTIEWYPGLNIQTQPLHRDELIPPKRGLLIKD